MSNNEVTSAIPLTLIYTLEYVFFQHVWTKKMWPGYFEFTISFSWWHMLWFSYLDWLLQEYRRINELSKYFESCIFYIPYFRVKTCQNLWQHFNLSMNLHKKYYFHHWFFFSFTKFPSFYHKFPLSMALIMCFLYSMQSILCHESKISFYDTVLYLYIMHNAFKVFIYFLKFTFWISHTAAKERALPTQVYCVPFFLQSDYFHDKVN